MACVIIEKGDCSVIKLKLNNDIWNEVDRRAADLPIFNGSHRKLAANIVGCLGEVVVEMWLDAEEVSITPELTETTHDYRLVNGSTFDVKTKDRTVSPRPYYDCSIPLYNHEHQRPDYYIFVSLERNGSNKDTSAKRYHTAWILGGLDRGYLVFNGE